MKGAIVWELMDMVTSHTAVDFAFYFIIICNKKDLQYPYLHSLTEPAIAIKFVHMVSAL